MAALTAAGCATGGHASETSSERDRLRLACIGVGGRGAENVAGVAGQEIVALVDVDEVRAAETFGKHPHAKRYTDYRRMLDELGSSIDGVVISTPDHTHFHPAYAAMQFGLHVYLEKPLAHNVWETRRLTEFAREQAVATQLGIQRHVLPNVQRVVQLVRSGGIGVVSEVYSWIASDRGMPGMPADAPAPPGTLDYNLWVGPVVEARPYHPSICPYGWRFWWDFGTGEAGNWGCHVLDIAFSALGLKHPTRVDAKPGEVDRDRTPTAMSSEFFFPESNQDAPVRLHWAQGVPPMVKELELPPRAEGKPPSAYNTLFVGSKGKLLCGFDECVLLPIDQFADFEPPSSSLMDPAGFYAQWINACLGAGPATCNFDYAGPLTEAVLLANVAFRAGGFDWDAATLSAVGNAKAQSLVREAYRFGWGV